MKSHLVIVSFLALAACGPSNTNEPDKQLPLVAQHKASTTKEQDANSDTALWINSFRNFRDALYQGDKELVKTFVDFPFESENNEIRYLAFGADEVGLAAFSDRNQPFSESEFDNHYNNIFPPTFIKSILKIHSKVLFEKGKYETQRLTDKETSYQNFATFDRNTNSLTLNLAFEYPVLVNDGDGEFIENSEHNILYLFEFTPDGKLKFKRVRLAG